MKLNTSQPMPCPYCRYYPVRARSREMSRDTSNIIMEHQWICPKCQNVARSSKEQLPVNSK